MARAWEPVFSLGAPRWTASSFLIQRVVCSETAHGDLQEINAALKASEERYIELFENANDAIFTVDIAGNFTSANRACEQLTGYKRSETSSMNFAQLVAPEYLGIARRPLEQKLEINSERRDDALNECLGAWFLWQFELQHHDGNDDGDDTVRKGFQTGWGGRLRGVSVGRVFGGIVPGPVSQTIQNHSSISTIASSLSGASSESPVISSSVTWSSCSSRLWGMCGLFFASVIDLFYL